MRFGRYGIGCFYFLLNWRQKNLFNSVFKVSCRFDLCLQKVLRGTTVLEKTTDSIQRSTQVAHETEEIGEAIMGDLTVQREGLERARNMLSDTDAELSRSRRILKRMSRGTIYNKMVLLFIIIVQVCIIGALVYWKWFK